MQQIDSDKKANTAYRERNMCVSLFAQLARLFQIPVGVGMHPEEEEWDDEWRHIVFIDLPLDCGLPGQVSWHIHDSELALFSGLPLYAGKWDGHTTDEKYERLLLFMGQLSVMPHLANLIDLLVKMEKVQ